MCGRFTLFEPDKVLAREFGVSDFPPRSSRYNIAPSQPVAAVRAAPAGTGRELALLRWGLVPSWSKDPAIGNRLINARAETVQEKPSFRIAFRRHRCLIPANGFYEWQRQERGKQPYFVRMRDVRLFAFAGLWDRWLDPALLNTDSLAPLLVPFPPEDMLAFPVSPRVNAPTVDDERCIAPLP